MKTYVYIQFDIKDMAAFTEYTQKVGETVHKYGGKTIAVNKSPKALEGEANTQICVIQEWNALEDIQKWLDSPEYAPLKKLRDEKAMSNLKIIPIEAV